MDVLRWWRSLRGRYIVNFVMTWQHVEKELKEFLEIYSQCHPSIK